MQTMPLVKLPGEFEFLMPGEHETPNVRRQPAARNAEATVAPETDGDLLRALRYAIPVSIGLWTALIFVGLALI